MNTKLPVPATVTRTVTDRVVFEIMGTGELELWDATRENKHSSVDLNVNSPQTVTYDLDSAFNCGAVIIQQSGWQVECRGEASFVLGSVDFPFIAGAPYKIYPQKDRIRQIAVKFEKAGPGVAVVITTKTAEGGQTQQRCDILPGTSFSVVFAAFSESIVVEEDGIKPGSKQHRVCAMKRGGTLTLDPEMKGVGQTIPLAED
jgi:hypothetical protein